MPSLLDSSDPVLSLLGNFVSLGRIGPDAVQPQGPTESGDALPTSMSPFQQSSAMDALLAAGASLANSAAPGFGPRPTWMQGITGALSAGRDTAVSDQVMQQAAMDAQLRRNIAQRQLENQRLASQMIAVWALGGGQQPNAPAGAPAGPGAAPGADLSGGAQPQGYTPPPGNAPGEAIRETLGTHEGGSRGYLASNTLGYLGRYQIGSGLAGDAGFYKPAEGEATNAWTGSFDIPGFPQVKTRDDFLRTPAAQDAAYSLAMSKVDQQLQANGAYDRGIGKPINGVPLTRDMLLAGAWLGGANGVKKWVDSGGVYNPADHPTGGARISDWAMLGAPKAPAAGAPGQAVPPLPSVQVAGPGAPTGAPPSATPAGEEDAATVLARLRGQQGAAPAATPASVAEAARYPASVANDERFPPAAGTPPAGAPPAAVPATAAVPPAGVAPPAPAALPVTTASPDTRAGAPIAAPRIPGMNASLMDSLPPRQRALVAASLLQMGPDQQAQALLKLASTPGPKPEFHETGAGVFAVMPDGQSVYFGPPTRAPATQTMLDAAGNRIQAQYDPARNIWFKIGNAPPPDASLPLTPERLQQELMLHPSQTLTLTVPGRGNVTYRLDPATKQPIEVGQAELPPELQPIPAERGRQNIFQAQQIESARKIAEARAARASDLETGGSKAYQTLGNLDTFEKLQAISPTGALAPQWGRIAGVARSFGVEPARLGLDPNKDTVGQALNAIANAFAVQMIGGQGGIPANNFSEQDRIFAKDIVPQLTNTPGGNKVIAAGMRNIAQRVIDKRSDWLAAQKADPTQDYAQFESAWEDKNKDRFTVIHDVSTPAEAAKLPPGALYRTPPSSAFPHGEIRLMPGAR